MAAQPTVRRVNGELKVGVKRGRPPGSTNLTPEEKRLRQGSNKIDYLRWKNEFQKPPDFYAYLAGYPDKTGLMATFYRLVPQIDVTLIGLDETGILKTATESEMTEDHCGATFGRGKYMLILNDGNRPPGQREVAKTWFDLTALAKPPVYDPRTLVLSNPKNIDEINRLCNIGVMIRDRVTGQVRLKTQDDPAPVAAAAAASQSSGLGSLDLGQVVANLLTQQSRNPHDAVKDTIEMARLLKPDSPPVDIELIVERIVHKLHGGGAVDADPFSMYTKVDAFINKIRGSAPVVEDSKTRGGGLARSWGPYIPGIFAELRTLMPEIRQTFDSFFAAKHAAQHNGGHAPQPRGQEMARPKTMKERIAEVMMLGFQRMQEGTRGYDFAAYVCGFHPGGREVFETLDPHGAAGVIGLIAMDPAGASFVNDPEIRPQIEAFLNDFFEFDLSQLPAVDGAPAAPPAGA